MAISDTQRAIVIFASGGPEVLPLEARRPPVPEADQVLIQIVAAGVNRNDCKQRKASPAREPNPIPGLEISGRTVVCGSAVAAVLPQIDAIYSLEQAADAHGHIERNTHIGKIMRSVADE